MEARYKRIFKFYFGLFSFQYFKANELKAETLTPNHSPGKGFLFPFTDRRQWLAQVHSARKQESWA